MTTSPMTWFYNPPENVPYLINERVNTTLWDERIGGVWLNVVRAEAPFEMTGTHSGAQVHMAWQPGEWLRLTTSPESPVLVKGLANVLRRKPALRYETTEGESVWEWWIDGADRRWQEIQGRPAFGRPERLDKAE